jgi:hypothetical protein
MIVCLTWFPPAPYKPRTQTNLFRLDLDAKEAMSKRHNKQAGDPIKGAKAMYKLAIMSDPPLRVVVGTDAYAGVVRFPPFPFSPSFSLPVSVLSYPVPSHGFLSKSLSQLREVIIY